MRKAFVVSVSLLSVLVLGFGVWASAAMKPAPEAFAALQPDAQVLVRSEEFIVFRPANDEPDTALVFYPGGRVDYRSYAAPLRQIAERGYLVILLPVQLNLAIFDIDAADRAIASYPGIRHWAVGGHSLGGVAAAWYAGRKEGIEAVVFWASYPADDSLRDTEMKILSIYGTLDMGGPDVFEASRETLPSGAEFVVIDGGNHAQFGDYGFQPGDNQATITRLDQQTQVVDATAAFLKELSQ